MLQFHKPTEEEIRRFLAEQTEYDFTYKAVGQTAFEPPAKYIVDHTRTKLGKGEHIFTAARSLLENWRQFEIGWLSAWPGETSIAKDEVIAIVAHTFGFWWLNACRIVYVIDEEANEKRFGFAYGTLPGHAGTGEERFLIEMDQEDNVWYDILAFSRPQHILARLGYPYVRHIQKQFGKQSAALMQQSLDSMKFCASR